MRCVSCNAILKDSERVSYKYIYDEDNPDVIINTGEFEDMCHSCQIDLAKADSYIDKDYDHNDIVDGLSPMLNSGES